MKKIGTFLKNTIAEEYKFIIILLAFYIILQIPVNYYIITGGGTSDVASRIQVEEGYSSKGSFNISFVTELQRANVFSYLLSYVIPGWDRESAEIYKYSSNESLKDIEFRSDLDLKTANGTATYWAYTLAQKEVSEISSKIFVITSYEEYPNPLKVGDQILSIDDHSYETVDEYKDYLQTKSVEDTITVKVLRNQKEKILETSLYQYEDYLILGVSLQIVKEYETNPTVSIRFNDSESGPSGGLITTLEIYNQLVKKDITKGYRIAGTGTIEEDGSIGQIGGIEHKILGAADDHVDIFLSPDGENYEDAMAYKKEKNLKIKIVKVKTIQEAIEILENLS